MNEIIQIYTPALKGIGFKESITPFVSDKTKELINSGYEVLGILAIQGDSETLQELMELDNPAEALPEAVTHGVVAGVHYWGHILKNHHRKGGRCKWFEFKGQKLQGKLELQLAQLLTEKGVKWVAHHKKTFRWQDLNGKNHWYQPDFYLPELDFYIEVKGFWTDEAQNKMHLVYQQNPKAEILVMMGTDINQFGKTGVLQNNGRN